jgi:hypothetical protein
MPAHHPDSTLRSTDRRRGSLNKPASEAAAGHGQLRIAAAASAFAGVAGLFCLLHGLPGASLFDPGTRGLVLGFCAQVALVFGWAVTLYGPLPAAAATVVEVTLVVAAHDSGLVFTDFAASTAVAALLFVASRCLLDPTIEGALLTGVAFAWARQAVPPAQLVAMLAAAVGGRWLGRTRHERFPRVLHGTLVAMALAVVAGSAIAFAVQAWWPALVAALAAPAEPPAFDVAVFPTVLLLVVVRPWRRHRIASDLALAGAVVVVIASVLPCTPQSSWWICVGSTSAARILLLATLPLSALLAAANWAHERPSWWRWTASGLLAVAVFQGLIG